MKKENLYNTTQKKTKKIINYIENLEPIDQWDIQKINKFEHIKNQALNQQTPNKMLNKIGFNPTGTDKIYDNIDIKENGTND